MVRNRKIPLSEMVDEIDSVAAETPQRVTLRIPFYLFVVVAV